MQLHQIKITYRRKTKKRIGRGGKRGTYSGRGQKGQKSRAGRRIRPAERDLIQRLPKLRGFKFKPLKAKALAINLGDLEKRLKGDIINLETLREAGFIKQRDKLVKILGGGEVKRPFIVQKFPIAKSAKRKIEAAGGTVKQ